MNWIQLDEDTFVDFDNIFYVSIQYLGNNKASIKLVNKMG